MAQVGALLDVNESALRKRGRQASGARLPNWAMMFVLLIVLALSVLALYLFSPGWFNLNRTLPVGLRSQRLANYAADPFTLAQLPLNERILEEALVDRADSVGAIGQLATLIEPLGSPVPSITPPFGATQVTPLASPTRSTPTLVPARPTATRTLSATLTPSATRTPTMLSTITKTATRLPTNTPQIYRPSPTSVTIHTPTRPAAPTATYAAPTHTAVSVPPTAIPPPTSTPIPPPPPVPTQPAYPPPGTAYP